MHRGLTEAKAQFAENDPLRAQVLSRLGIVLSHRSTAEKALLALLEASSLWELANYSRLAGIMRSYASSNDRSSFVPLEKLLLALKQRLGERHWKV